jgi:hypothetical protein
MSLRKQSPGKQKPWTEEELSAGLVHFYKEHKKYPTSQEVDSYPYLPSARSIQRSHGGLVVLRKKLKLASEVDFRTGTHSSKRAKTINKRSHKIEADVHQILIDRFGVEFVHREFFFTDDRRARTDFYVYTEKGTFCVDVFYPKDKHSLLGCLNSKMRTYKGALQKIIFLMMNPDISSGEVKSILENKKNKLANNQTMHTLEDFKVYIREQEPKRSI